MSKSETKAKYAERVRRLATDLERRRNQIAKAQRVRSVLLGAYELVTADLWAACGRGSDSP